MLDKEDTDYNLLDTIILEGLAEHAVAEQLGEKNTAKWTTYYSGEELERIWQRLIQPVHNLTSSHRKYYGILYGKGFYPKMAGYCVGYYLVGKYTKNSHLSSKQLLTVPAEEIAGLKES